MKYIEERARLANEVAINIIGYPARPECPAQTVTLSVEFRFCFVLNAFYIHFCFLFFFVLDR